jgi:hypothetical protein
MPRGKGKSFPKAEVQSCVHFLDSPFFLMIPHQRLTITYNLQVNGNIYL